jgi:subtilisin family serine protease
MKGRLLLAASLILGIAGAAAAQPGGQGPSRVIVQFKDGVAFDRYLPDYRPDPRLADAQRHGYHSRGVLGAIMALERRHGFRADAFYSRALKGFAAPVTDAQRRRLEADPLVASIEADEQIALEPITPAAQIVDWGINRIGADISSTASGNGDGSITSVNIYVIDTGVDVTHPDLNVVEHVTMTGAPNADCNGHGTGVAGIIAAKDNGDYTVGVVPGAPVHGVKVFSCEGLTFPSFIIQGVDWVTAHAAKPAVVNMSLGSLIPLIAVNTAVQNSAATGIVYAIAAGNGNPFTGEAVNACYSSPAGAGYDSPYINGIITTAATDQVDTEASFSNFGVCVNIWAPGVQVTSLWLMSSGGTFTGSGTSFASPYVAGGAALLLSRAPTLPPAWVEFLLRYVADVPGTFSKDGAQIRRLQIRYF